MAPSDKSGRAQQPQSGPSLPLGRKLCWPWSLAPLPSARREAKEEPQGKREASQQDLKPYVPWIMVTKGP